jgi:uncharacterized protein YaiI (UPF0178 family)
MKIWIDGDACPKQVKEVIFRASERTKSLVMIVANKAMRVTHSPLIQLIVVSDGFDAADHYIVEHTETNDMVITADIPLASALVDKGVMVINSRGMVYTSENIKEVLAVRNLMEELRGGGFGSLSGGPAAYGPKDLEKFSNSFDRELARLVKKQSL